MGLMADPLPRSVPPPTPPDAADAWYAPTVRNQYAVGPDLVATVHEREDGFAYSVREPSTAARTEALVERATAHLEHGPVDRPRTREGTVERMAAGLDRTYRRLIDRWAAPTPDRRRRIEYHLGAAVEGLGDLTPLALDDRIRVADASGDRLAVHTADFAPARTSIPTDAPDLARFASERVASYDVPVHGHDVPVTVYRERVLGGDAFATKYHVGSPVRLPGDAAHVAATKRTLIDESVGRRVEDPTAYVERRARRLLSRRLIADRPLAAIAGPIDRFRGWLAAHGLADPPVASTDRPARLDALVHAVVRDLVAEGPLSVPIRDPNVERVEANRVGDRVKVVPRPGAFDARGRMPTTIWIDEERRFVGLATRLAAAGGVELGPRTPTATVTIEPTPDTPVTCSVAIPAGDVDDPYIAVDKRGLTPTTPVDAIRSGAVGVDLVALCWLAIERRRRVAVVGPDRARPDAIVEALAPFIPYGDRPVTVAGGTRTITLPHETGVDLSPSGGEPSTQARSGRLGDLAPDVTVLTALDGATAHRHLADAVAAGRGVLASTSADGIETFAHRAVANGVPLRIVGALDLLVVLNAAGGRRRVAAVELPSSVAGDDARPIVEGEAATLYATGLPHEDGDLDVDPFVAALADSTDASADELRADYRRRRHYVRYLVETDRSDVDELFSFLADLRTDEAATVERIHRVLDG